MSAGAVELKFNPKDSDVAQRSEKLVEITSHKVRGFASTQKIMLEKGSNKTKVQISHYGNPSE